MDAQGSLEIVAEISIAFTGFAGIVGALAGPKLNPAQRHVWLPFWTMIECGLGTLFAALFPLLPYLLGCPDQVVWAVSSAFVVLLVIAHAAFMAPPFLRAMRDPSYVRVPALARPLYIAFPLVLLSQTLNALGIGLPQGAGGFFIGLYLLLLISALNFAYLMLVLIRPSGGSRAA